MESSIFPEKWVLELDFDYSITHFGLVKSENEVVQTPIYKQDGLHNYENS